jgi:anti-sigma factor RsiW
MTLPPGNKRGPSPVGASLETSPAVSAPHPSPEQLSAYLDGEVSPSVRVAVEAHLAACGDCRSRLAALGAVGALVRTQVEGRAERVDFSGLADRVLFKLEAERPSLAERLRVAWEEWRTHRPGILVGGMGLVTAGLALLLLVPEQVADTTELRSGAMVRSVSTDEQAHVAPVVLKTEGGDAIIWLVDHPDRPSLNIGNDASVPEVTPPPQPRPKAGEL